MDSDDFWELIETTRASAVAGRAFHEVLADLLADGTEQEILENQEKFDEALQALYRWDVWAAAYLIGGGCSDDSFIDFRALWRTGSSAGAQRTSHRAPGNDPLEARWG